MSKGATEDEIRRRLQNIDPYDFEYFVSDLWESQGWETEVSQASNDMGVDIIGEKSDGLVDQKVAIQAKRYTDGNSIGRPDIQQYLSLRQQDSKTDAVVVVTTSSFASTAEEYASNHNVNLVDGDDLVELIQEGREHLLDEYAPVLGGGDTTDDTIDTNEPTSNQIVPDTRRDAETELPGPFNDEENRRRAAIGSSAIGLFLIINPTNIGGPIGSLGTIFLVLGAIVYFYPEEAWEKISPTEVLIKEFREGKVVEKGGTVKYKGDDGEKVFDNFEDNQRNTQQAVLYGELVRQNGRPPEVEKGRLPTKIVSSGETETAAYRFAVQNEPPEEIAADMDMSQQEIVNRLSGYTS
ncbi:restriction endonuclease [Natronomonas sp. LN261]|uniref:restriction endonuclease n=1 Tax=Natronomonas sp. LN261 TaxID=2750669 RepID=UPI0015EE8507|nr:restriction endonuclease [Natronomonas sp. LN261]